MDHISFNSIYMRFGAGLQAWVESRMRLYASRDGSLLALRNEAGGPLCGAPNRTRHGSAH